MIVVTFQTALRPDADLAAYQALAGRVCEIASQMPGFVSMTETSLDDGDSLVVVRFETAETMETWRRHPEHLEPQRQGERVVECYSGPGVRVAPRDGVEPPRAHPRSLT